MLIERGAEIDLGRWSLGPKDVDAYLQAIQDHSSIYNTLSVVPPLALVAHALKEIIKRLSLPPGTLHATQEVKCLKGVNLGESVTANASLGRPLRRGEWQFISTDFSIRSDDGKTALSGRTTVIIPSKEGVNDQSV